MGQAAIPAGGGPETGLWIAGAAVVVVFFVYLINRQGRLDSWTEKFTTLHRQIWWEDDMRQVREWLANDQAYDSLRLILIKRRTQYEGNQGIRLTAKEFEKLDKLDRFVHHNIYCMTVLETGAPRKPFLRVYWYLKLTSYHLVDFFWVTKGTEPERPITPWARLFASYWLTKMIVFDAEYYDGPLPRPEVAWYVQTFTPRFHNEVSNYIRKHGISPLPGFPETE